jgi:hypothetical protein
VQAAYYDRATIGDCGGNFDDDRIDQFCGTLCQGCAWTVSDKAELAKRIGFVALGQSRHVAKILAGINAIPPVTSASTRIAAIKLLTLPGGADPWHRGGWLFQTMSWLAASQENPCPPHDIRPQRV